MHLAKSGVPGVGTLYSGKELGRFLSASSKVVRHSDCVYLVAISPSTESIKLADHTETSLENSDATMDTSISRTPQSVQAGKLLYSYAPGRWLAITTDDSSLASCISGFIHCNYSPYVFSSTMKQTERTILPITEVPLN